MNIHDTLVGRIFQNTEGGGGELDGGGVGVDGGGGEVTVEEEGVAVRGGEGDGGRFGEGEGRGGE